MRKSSEKKKNQNMRKVSEFKKSDYRNAVFEGIFVFAIFPSVWMLGKL